MHLFKNRQWAVTLGGMSSIGPGVPYDVERSRLLETTDRGSEGTFYDWPVHLAEKTWVNIEAFIEAFGQALKIHERKLKGRVDPALLEASYRKARQIARELY